MDMSKSLFLFLFYFILFQYAIPIRHFPIALGTLAALFRIRSIILRFRHP